MRLSCISAFFFADTFASTRGPGFETTRNRGPQATGAPHWRESTGTPDATKPGDGNCKSGMAEWKREMESWKEGHEGELFKH